MNVSLFGVSTRRKQSIRGTGDKRRARLFPVTAPLGSGPVRQLALLPITIDAVGIIIHHVNGGSAAASIGTPATNAAGSERTGARAGCLPPNALYRLPLGRKRAAPNWLIRTLSDRAPNKTYYFSFLRSDSSYFLSSTFGDAIYKTVLFPAAAFGLL